MKAKAFALLSGGVDSTTALYIAMKEFDGNVEGVSIFYGQRHRKEIDYAEQTCHKLGIAHKLIDLSSVVPSTMLTDKDKAIPEVSYSDIKGVSPTYVPFRNGLMLSAVASYAAGRYAEVVSLIPALEDIVEGDPRVEAALGEWAIYFGAHAEDAQNWAYPDCSSEFTGAVANAIYVGTYHQIRLHTPLQWMVKSEIIKKGFELGVNFADTFSCYKGEELHCGVCPTCRSRRQGFIDAGVPDPTKYSRS